MATFLDFLSGGIQSDFAPQAAPPPPPDPASRFDTYFNEASKETGVPVAILKAQAMQESSFDPNVVSKTGGIGLLQIQPSTAAQPGYGVEPIDSAKLTDPAENIRFGARYLAARAKSEGVQNWNDPQQVAKGLAAYNGGGDPNYVQNVFRYLKPPSGGADAPANGPVDAYGTPLVPRGQAQTAPSQPQAPASDPGNFVTYANQSATRNKPLQPELVSAMGFLPQLGVTMRVNSGGQDGIGEGSRRTGSTRHDHGGAGDVQFMRDGKALSWESPQDVPILQQIVRQARQNGVTGIGAGPGYMNPTTTHIGFGKAAIWGAQGGSPYPALAEAVGGVPAGTHQTAATGGRAPLNPNVTAAAQRGQGPAADRPARGSAMTSGQMPMPPRQMADTTSADNGGILEFLRQQMGQGQDVAAPGPQQAQGGLGGLGGFIAQALGGGQSPQPGGSDVASLIPRPAGDPFALFGERKRAEQQAQAEYEGKVFTAKQFMAQGMSPQQAAAAVNAPGVGQQLALGGIQQQKAASEQARLRTQLDGPQERSPAPAQASPQQQPAPTRPAAPVVQGQVEPTASANPGGPTSTINSGNRTVDALFAQRGAKVAELVSLYKVPATPATEGMIKSRAEGLKAQIGDIDKQVERYAPTNDMKEYFYAMDERLKRGEPIVPKEQWSPEEERKRAGIARGGLPEEATSLRKEVQGLPSYKNISQAAPIYKSMMDAVGRDTRASDVNMIYGLAKIMDPTSVVRESEMTVAQAIATLPQQIQQNIKSQLGTSGRLSKDVREGIMQEAYSRMNSYNQLFGQDTEQYRGIAQRRKIDLADVIPNFGDFKAYEPPEAKSKAGANGSTGAAPVLREVPPQYVRPDGSSPPMPSAPTPPKAFTKSEWDKLEPGTLYLDAKGDTRRKGAN